MNFHVSLPHPQYYMTSQIVVCAFNISAFFDFNKFLISQIVKSGWRAVEMNCIANDSKCTKFRNICFLFGPAPEEKTHYWMYASMNNRGE